VRVGVVGGGIFGVSTAWELARRGHAVELFERRRIPAPDAAGTDISKAIRMEYGAATPLYGPLVVRALYLWRELERVSGEGILEQPGVLFLASAFDESRFEWQSAQAVREMGGTADVIDAKDAALRWPQFSWKGLAVGVWNPDGGWLRAATAVETIARVARAAGATVFEDTPVDDVAQSDRSATIRAGGRTCEYDLVVVCAGPWIARVLPEVTSRVRVTRQQISLYRPADASAFDGSTFPVWVHDIVEEGWYGFPSNEGVVKIALHRRSEEVDPDVSREPDDGFLQQSRAFAREHLPALDRHAPLAGRACLYTNSRRGDLVVDRVPGHDRIVVAGLGSGHGFKFGPVLGELVADLIEKDEVPPMLRFGQARDEEVW